jgi:hypothetical protein
MAQPFLGRPSGRRSHLRARFVISTYRYQAQGGPCSLTGVGDQRSPEGEAPGSPE